MIQHNHDCDILMYGSRSTFKRRSNRGRSDDRNAVSACSSAGDGVSTDCDGTTQRECGELQRRGRGSVRVATAINNNKCRMSERRQMRKGRDPFGEVEKLSYNLGKNEEVWIRMLNDHKHILL